MISSLESSSEMSYSFLCPTLVLSYFSIKHSLMSACVMNWVHTSGYLDGNPFKNRATSLCFSIARPSHMLLSHYPSLHRASHSPPAKKNVEIKLIHLLALLCGSNSFYFLRFHLYIRDKNLLLASLGYCNSENEIETLDIKVAEYKNP